MAYDKITRTNIQALYRYMPGQPYNWGTNKPSVIGLTPRQTTSLEVPERWVAPQLLRLIRPFSKEGASSEALQVIEREQFVLVQAEDLQAERFPNTFFCSRCERFRVVRVGERPPACPGGHGDMNQFAWAEVHECGHLGDIAPPRCDQCRSAQMRLRNTSSFRTKEWFWACERCQTKSGRPVANWCATCRRGRVELRRIPQSSLHYTQQITVLNPPDRATFATLAHEDVHRAAVAQCLGELPVGLDGLRVASGAGPADNAIRKVHDLAATMGLKPGDPMYDDLLERAQQSQGDTPAWADAVDALGRDPEVIDEFGEECLQLTLARGTKKVLTAEQLLENAEGRELEPTYRKYPVLFQRYGLADVTLLRELPIAYLIAGYTRLSPKAKLVTKFKEVEPVFRFFDSRSSKFPVYGVRTETEGLLFQLNHLEVIKWLVDSEVVADPNVTTASDAKRWLFHALSPVTDPFAAPADVVTKAVLGLVHSMAHRAMKALAARCGLNVDSLAEYLFPANCAFLIYANTRSEFTLGGLEHVFRYDLADALEELDAESRCVFDPPCRHNFGGSCAACLHVSEVACARFNTVLDRNLLFGTLPSNDGSGTPESDGKVRWRAYWNR